MVKKKIDFIEDPLVKETKMRLMSVRIAKMIMTTFELGYEYGKLDDENKK